MSTPTPEDFVECTTVAKLKRHWSLQPTVNRGLRPLCDLYSRGYDQEWVTDSLPPRWRKRVAIVELPPCKRCEKAKASRLAAALTEGKDSA